MSKRTRSPWLAAVLATAAAAIVLHAEGAEASFLGRTGEIAAHNGEVAFDLVVLRPLSATALLAGSVFFVAAAPFSTPYEAIKTGHFVEAVQPAWSTFVYAPYEYTVLRELGEF